MVQKSELTTNLSVKLLPTEINCFKRLIGHSMDKIKYSHPTGNKHLKLLNRLSEI